jgi:hypothetical protein
MQHAGCAAEAYARVLLLALARTIVFEPRDPALPRTRAPRIAHAHRGRGLFAWRRSTASLVRWRRQMTDDEHLDWHAFGGRERAAEERARRTADGWPQPVAATRRRLSPAIVIAAPLPPGAPTPPAKANLIARFNALVALYGRRDAAAARLARRLAVQPTLAVRVVAGAFPARRWSTGHDADIRRLARSLAHPDSS